MADIDHVAEARRLLASAMNHSVEADPVWADQEGVLAAAQVNATLAMVDVLHEIAHAVGVVPAGEA